VSALTARMRKCVCTRCSDGFCGVRTVMREYRGYPMCSACQRGVHRIRVVTPEESK